jgi:hypothetical protein
MAVGEEGDEQALDDLLLPDDGLADFITEFLGPGWAGVGRRGMVGLEVEGRAL